MATRKFSDEFKVNAVKLAGNRGDRTLISIAKELNIAKSTLNNWLKQIRAQLNLLSGDSKQWTATEKLRAIAETHSLSGEALSQWYQMKGLFEHQLASWKKEFVTNSERKATDNLTAELRALKEANKKLAVDLKRKNKALVESAALLVLSKKYQALISSEDD